METASQLRDCSVPDSQINSCKQYTWTADLVWRNRSFKSVHVFYDPLAGQLGFSKTKADPTIFTGMPTFVDLFLIYAFIPLVKFPEKCFGIDASFEEHLVILHTIDKLPGLEDGQIQSQRDIFYFYLSEESEVDRFRIVLSNALQALQGKKRFLVVLNRGSGQGRAGKAYDNIVAPMLKTASTNFLLRESEYNRHISLFASQFDPLSIDGIILIGGDGTVNEFLNGLCSRKDFSAIQGSLPITLVPCGVKLQLATRFALGDTAMAVFTALRGHSCNLYPIAFVQARRRFYGHSYLHIKPKKRTYIKLHYLNNSNNLLSMGPTSDTATEYSGSADSIVSKGPSLLYYHKFIKLDNLGKDITTSTAAFGPRSDLKLTNTFDPSKNHPLALMSQSNQSNPLNRLWNSVTCSKLFSRSPSEPSPSATSTSTTTTDESWPRLLAMTKAGLLEIEDTTAYPPSLNKDRWYVDGEIIGTESVYFESLENPILITIPPDYITNQE
jgi:hypothetical protein